MRSADLLAAVAATLVVPAARAQDLPDPLVVRALHRELARVRAYQASSFSHTGDLGGASRAGPWLGPSLGAPPLDAADTLVVLQLTGTESAWSAVVLHRAVPGLRCGLSLGSAIPPLNARITDSELTCVDAAGTPVATDVLPDSAWIFWWQDEALDRVPVGQCPALQIPYPPETNDTIHIEFLVGSDGRVERAPVSIESPGDLAWTVAALMRLDGCRFDTPTSLGHPVRMLLRHSIALAPNLPIPPPPAPRPDPTDLDRLADPAHLGAMYEALTALASAQEAAFDTGGTYAPSAVGRLGRPPAGTHVAVLSWSDSGWSAVATHDSVARTVLCGVRVGPGPHPIDTSFGDGAPRCRDTEGNDLTGLAREAATQPAGERPHGAEVDEPPRRLNCNTNVRLRERDGGMVDVVLDFVLGRDGKPEPRTIRVVSSTGHPHAAAAVELLQSCQYDPGRVNGEPVRVVIRQPVLFR